MVKAALVSPGQLAQKVNIECGAHQSQRHATVGCTAVFRFQGVLKTR